MHDVGYFTELVEQPNNELSHEIILSGCTKLAPQSLLLLQMNAPTIIHSDTSFTVSISVEESFAFKGENNPSQARKEYSISAAFSKASQCAEINTSSNHMIIYEKKIEASSARTEDTVDDIILLYDKAKFSVQIMFSTHLELCWKHWNLYFQLTSNNHAQLNADNITTCAWQPVFVLCPDQILSIQPSINQLLPHDVLPEIQYPISFYFTMDIYDKNQDEPTGKNLTKLINQSGNNRDGFLHVKLGVTKCDEFEWSDVVANISSLACTQIQGLLIRH